MNSKLIAALVAVLVVALIAAGAVAAVQTQRLAEAERREAALEAELDQLRDRVEALEQRLADQDPAESGPDQAGDEQGDGLDALLEGMLGGEDAMAGAACFTPDGGGLGGLADLFGGSEPTPDDQDELVAQVADQVAELRELAWQEPVEATFLDDAAIGARLEELIDEALDREALDASQRLLVALGAIPVDADLERIQRDLLDDQVAGFYSPDTGELAVRVPDGGRLRALDRVTLAHELEHALADQVLGLPDRDQPPFVDDTDATLAVLAVVEGDATLLMNLWALEHLSLAEQLSMAMDGDLIAAQAALGRFPHYVQRELVFPYVAGLDWACDTFLEQGWAGIDAAYADPPATTAEVLWGEVAEVAEPPTLAAPDGFEELAHTTLGAAQLLWLFEAPGDDTDRALDDPRDRARAWGGGATTVWGRGEDSAVGLALVDRGNSVPLCDTIADWYTAAFPSATSTTQGEVMLFAGEVQGAALRCQDGEVALGIGPDTAVAGQIVG